MVIDFYLMMDLHDTHISILPHRATRNIFRVPNKQQQQQRRKLEMRVAPLGIEWCSCASAQTLTLCMLHNTMAKLINIGLCRH